MTRARRGAMIVTICALLVSGLVLDRVIARPRAASAGPPIPTLPQTAQAGALSSTWFCPPATATPNGVADGRIVVLNPGDNPLTGTVSVAPSQGSQRIVAIAVAPRERIVLRFGDIVNAPYAAALVQLDGASGAVEEQVRGQSGDSGAPCATRASDHWYFATGNTQASTHLLLALFNPFPEDAVIDATFATDTGPFTPADLQGLVVPAGGVSVVDLGDHVRRRNTIGTTLSLRSGRIVASKIQIEDPTPARDSPRGITLVLGDPAPGLRWYFPDGLVQAGFAERYDLYDPGDQPANVRVTLAFEGGSAEPFTVTVAPHEDASIDVNHESRLPPGVRHAGIAESLNGVPIVAERVMVATAPFPRAGMSESLGAPQTATQWLFPAGAADAAQDEWLTTWNPGPGTAHISVTVFSGGIALRPSAFRDVALPAGSRVALRLLDQVTSGDLAVVVESEEPVVVERDVYRVGAVGMAAMVGIVGGSGA